MSKKKRKHPYKWIETAIIQTTKTVETGYVSYYITYLILLLGVIVSNSDKPHKKSKGKKKKKLEG